VVTTLLAATTASTRTLAWPWVGVAVLAVALVAAVVTWVLARRARRRRALAADRTWVAHTARLARVPEVRRWLRRYRAWQWAGIGTLTVAVVGAGVLAARPVTVRTDQSVLGTRDIVLCLDVSGSMLAYDQQMVKVFDDLVADFDGERIGLTVFNRTSRTVFPLTDDYALVHQELAEAYQALDPAVLETTDPTTIERYLAFTAGTTSANSDDSSLIGDGLASCALQLDDPDGTGSGTTPQRARSIVLATDNDLRGTPIYTLPEAVALTRSLHIELDALFGQSAYASDATEEDSYRQAVEAGGGHFYEGVYDRGAVFLGMSVLAGVAGYFAAQELRPTSPSTAIASAIFSYALPMLVGAYDARTTAEKMDKVPRYHIDYDTSQNE